MSKVLFATLAGALSILFLAGLARDVNRMSGPIAAQPLPAISTAAQESHGPRECSATLTTGCTYQ